MILIRVFPDRRHAIAYGLPPGLSLSLFEKLLSLLRILNFFHATFFISKNGSIKDIIAMKIAPNILIGN